MSEKQLRLKYACGIIPNAVYDQLWLGEKGRILTPEEWQIRMGENGGPWVLQNW